MKKKKVSKKRTSGIIRIRRPKVEKVKIEAPEAPVENIVLNEASNIHLESTPEIMKEAEKEIEIEEEKEIRKGGKIEMRLPSPPGEHDESNILKIVGIALCIIVVLFWIALAIFSTQINPGPKIIAKNVSVTSFSITTVSFSRFTNITDVKYTENLSQLGYLREEKSDTGYVKKYLVDDEGRKIELVFRGALRTVDQFDELFTLDNTTTQLYNVTGTYKFEINGFFIDVQNITTAEKKITETSVWRVENITTDDVKGVTFSIARGVNKIFSFHYTG